jgi:hypothetical protein
MARHFDLLLLLLLPLARLLLLDAAPNKLVRIALHKDTQQQAGNLTLPVTSYYARAEIGTPPKPFNLLLDVSAREVWVPHYSRLGLIYSRLNYKNGYCKKDSSTSVKEPNEIYKIQYSETELSGKAYRDVLGFVDVLPAGSPPVKFEQRFLAISSASNDKFTKFGSADGVMAFSPWRVSETGSDSIGASMIRSNLTSALTIGLALSSPAADGAELGELSIGGPNPEKYVLNSVRYHSVISQYTWAVGLQRVMVGSSPVEACSRSNNGTRCVAELSTTASDIYGPNQAIGALLNLLGFDEAKINFHQSQVYEIDCIKVASAPSLNFMIDGALYTIPPTSYIKKKVDGLIFKSSTCYVGLLPNWSEDKWTLGTSFLANFYTILDAKNLMNLLVGFGTPR